MPTEPMERTHFIGSRLKPRREDIKMGRSEKNRERDALYERIISRESLLRANISQLQSSLKKMPRTANASNPVQKKIEDLKQKADTLRSLKWSIASRIKPRL